MIRFSFWVAIAALVGLLCLGWAVIAPVVVAMWPEENLRTAALLFGALYLAQLCDISLGAMKRWYEMQIAARKKSRAVMVDPDEENEPGILNITMEDCLAMVPEEARPQVIKAWILFGTEYAARELGKAQTREFLNAMHVHVATAEANPPWRE